MNELTIKINEGELKNLFIFLDRVELKGKEALEYVRILQILDNAKVGDE